MKLLLIAMLAVAGTAHAGSDKSAGTALSFNEIKDACADPARFQNQVAPTNLQVTCEEHVTKWLATPSSTVALPTSREMVSSLSSDKYTVAPTSTMLDSADQNGACPKYKEVLETITFTKATSCDELQNFKGTESEFCTDIVDKVRSNNPKAVTRTDTGNTKDLCEAPSEPQRDQRGQRDQRDQRDQRGQRGQRGQVGNW